MEAAEPTPSEILDAMRVPEAANLYVLGSFERRVTLYSQQVRALNLVYALAETLRNPDVSIAVIGAGAGGLTVAAAAAACGCRVSVFERLGQPLGFIGPAHTRWLHPHIYQWPEFGSEEADAGLPLLNWREGSADVVRDTLVGQWVEIAERYNIDVHHVVTDLGIGEPVEGRHVLRWNGEGPAPARIALPATGSLALYGARPGRRLRMARFDIVILAVGFGVESRVPNSRWCNRIGTATRSARKTAIRRRPHEMC